MLVICFAAGLASCGLLSADKVPAELGGSWIVQQIAGASLGEHVEIFLEIDAKTGGITGFTGCNRFSAPMAAFGDALSVSAIQEQPGECATAAAATDEARFLAVLPLVRRYARRGNSLELLPQGYGEALLKLRVDNFGRLTHASAQH
jgi:heat shock protein HslJ